MIVMLSKYIVRKVFYWRYLLIKSLPNLFNYLFINHASAVPIFKRFMKVYNSLKRKELDISFLETCLEEKMIPSFIFKMKLSDCLSSKDVQLIHRRTLRRMLESEKIRRTSIDKKLTNIGLMLNNATNEFCLQVCVEWCIKNSIVQIKFKENAHIKKLINLRKIFGISKFSVENTVINLSKIVLNDDEERVLKFGPNHCIKNRLDETKLCAKIESLYFHIARSMKGINGNYVKSSLSASTMEYIDKNKKQNIRDFMTLKNLAKKNINICKFDKGNGIVILDHDVYVNKLNDLLNSPQFVKLPKGRKNGKLPPLKDEEFVQKMLNGFIEKKLIDEEVGKSIRPIGSQPAKLYGLPKIHKDGVPMRPVLSMVGTAQYKIAKFLDGLLKPLMRSEFECKDSFEFVSCIAKLQKRSMNDVMVSFDVCSLFTNVPLVETIDLCCALWNENDSEHHILDRRAFRKLLEFATSNVNFLFNDEWYQQIDGVAMGSPLAPTMASIFLASLEKKIASFQFEKPFVYKRYVDDIFLIFENQKHVEPFLHFMNSLHKNIVFTCETERKSSIAFLDLLIQRKDKQYETEIYRKPTDTGLYTSPESFCEFKYKRNMVKGLIYRSWALSSTFANSVKSVDKLVELLIKNGYSKSFLLLMIKETVDKLIKNPKDPCCGKSECNLSDGCELSVDLGDGKNGYKKIEPKYVLVLPYSEGFTNYKRKLGKLIGNLEYKIVSNSCKVRNMFINKSKTPVGLCSDLVYQFTCNGCNATYIGETSRHLCTRVLEHCRLKGLTNISEHNRGCKSDIGMSDFRILLRSFNSYWERVICEALLIRSLDPKINVQSAVTTNVLNVFK